MLEETVSPAWLGGEGGRKLKRGGKIRAAPQHEEECARHVGTRGTFIEAAVA